MNRFDSHSKLRNCERLIRPRLPHWQVRFAFRTLAVLDLATTLLTVAAVSSHSIGAFNVDQICPHYACEMFYQDK